MIFLRERYLVLELSLLLDLLPELWLELEPLDPLLGVEPDEPLVPADPLPLTDPLPLAELPLDEGV